MSLRDIVVTGFTCGNGFLQNALLGCLQLALFVLNLPRHSVHWTSTSSICYWCCLYQLNLLGCLMRPLPSFLLSSSLQFLFTYYFAKNSGVTTFVGTGCWWTDPACSPSWGDRYIQEAWLCTCSRKPYSIHVWFLLILLMTSTYEQ